MRLEETQENRKMTHASNKRGIRKILKVLLSFAIQLNGHRRYTRYLERGWDIFDTSVVFLCHL